MTPVNFVTFLFSLLLIDLRYTMMRTHTHAAGTYSRLPAWLHALIYRPRHSEAYYHSKQKKLMRMEAEEAFRFRNTMLVLLAGATIGMAASVWYVVGRVSRHWSPA